MRIRIRNENENENENENKNENENENENNNQNIFNKYNNELLLVQQTRNLTKSKRKKQLLSIIYKTKKL